MGDTINYVKVMIGKATVLKFYDFPGSNYTTFRREILLKRDKKALFIYENGNRIFYKKEKGFQTINKIDKVKKISNKFITLDIETREIDTLLTP